MKSNPTTEQIKRGEFLRSLGLSSAALMAFYCMGTTLTSCSKSSTDDPAPNPTGTGFTGNADTSKGAVSFTLDLTSSTYSKLKTLGAFEKIGGVIVANTTGGKYVAVERICTHEQQDLVRYRLTENNFICDAHGSVFSTDGKVVVQQKANQPALIAYKTSLSSDGNTLTVTA